MQYISNRSRKIAAILASVVFILLGLFYYLFSPNKSEVLVPGNTALTVCGKRISVGMYNYIFKSMLTELELGVMRGEITDFDSEKPLDEQQYSKDETWLEHLHKQTKDQLFRIVQYSIYAEENGIELLPEQEERIHQTLLHIEESAKKNEISKNIYVSAIYGKFVGLKTVSKVMRMTYSAQNYYEFVQTQKKVTEKQINEYASQNSDSLLTASFVYAAIPYTEKNFDTFFEIGQKILDEAADSEDFTDRISRYHLKYGWESVRVDECSRNSFSSFSAELTDWIYDKTRQKNDRKLFDDGNGILYCVLVVSTAKQENELRVTAREIFIEEEEKDDSKQIVDNILKSLQTSENIQYTFSVLADTFTDDVQERYSGGLKVALAHHGSEADNWLFSDSRKEGDYTCFESKNGYSILMFVSKEEAWKSFAKQQLIYSAEDIKFDAEKCVEKWAFGKHLDSYFDMIGLDEVIT